jgi:hypothetical protein
MRKIIALFTLVIISIQFSKGQSPAEFYSKEFKWRMPVPAGFVQQSLAQYEANQNQGAAMIGKGLNTTITDRAHQVCSFKYGRTDYFEANEHPFSQKRYGDFLASCNNIENEFYTGFKNQVSDKYKIDTLRSTETIDGLVFQYFKIQVLAGNKAVANLLFYSRLFGDNELSILMVYATKESGDKMIAAWKGSKFEKD